MKRRVTMTGETLMALPPAAEKLCTATGCTSTATYVLRGLPMCSRHGAAALDWSTRQD
jgi:hypothetical protein